MASGRYDNRFVAVNKNPLYQKYLKDSRGLPQIQQYSTPQFNHPSVAQIRGMRVISHTWKLGDRYYKLAHEHYGDSEMWWVIALFNKKPTEAHVKAGDTIYIPGPIEIVVQQFMSNKY